VFVGLVSILGHADNHAMKIVRHARHADRVMRVEGTLAVAGVGGGVLLWSQAWHFGGYGFAAAAFLGLLGVNAGVRALHNYNRWRRGAEGEGTALSALRALPDDYLCIANFVVPGTRQGDTDLLVLGPFGVLAVEVKTYTAHYGCQGDAWFCVLPDGSRQPLRSSVSRQVKRGRKAVQHYLVDCDVSVPVHAVAAFPPATRLDLAHPTVPIVRTDGLADYILALPPARPPVCTSEIGPLFLPPPLTERAGTMVTGRVHHEPCD
jgi:hypothetical protein